MDILEQVAVTRAVNLGFTLCNRTQQRLWTAIARRKGETWESRGWWQLEAGGCARVVDAPLLQGDNYVYAEMEVEGNKVRTLKSGASSFCVSRAKFAIEGKQECEAAAYRTALFSPAPDPTNRQLVYEFFERDFTAPVDKD